MNQEMKRLLFVLFCLTINIIAFPVTFDVDGVRYEIISQSDRTVSVTIIPKSLSYPSYSTYSGDFSIPETVQFNGITFDVIGIGTHAFSECRSLGKVTLPNSIRFIGFGAFAYSSLKSLILPEGLDSIGAAAFRDSDLEEITLPKSLRVLESTVFYRCYSLTKVRILSDRISAIPESSFGSCSVLKEINIPESVLSIGSSAFMQTQNLYVINIPSKVKEIGPSCFYNSGILSIDIPDAVTELDGQMFYGCKNLKTIKLPSSLRSLNKQMFRGCTSLESIIIPEGITSIPQYAFAECTSLASVKFPTSLQSIEDNSFSYCTSLESIHIPEGVTKIWSEAFYGCNLSEIFFPTTLESVGGWAFGLGDIKELTLPASLRKIGNYAFDDTQLESIICLNPIPYECEENVFKNETYLYATLQVPQESLNLYKSTSPWKNFFNIEGHSLTNIDDLTDSINPPIKHHINVNGQISDRPLQGVNIIRYKDGSTRKILIR